MNHSSESRIGEIFSFSGTLYVVSKSMCYGIWYSICSSRELVPRRGEGREKGKEHLPPSIVIFQYDPCHMITELSDYHFRSKQSWIHVTFHTWGVVAVGCWIRTWSFQMIIWKDQRSSNRSVRYVTTISIDRGNSSWV